MRGNGTGREPPTGLSDGVLWRHSRMIDMAEDEAERYLDLAGFADLRLDPDDRERIAERLAGDPIMAGDVAAARALGGAAERLAAVPAAILARATGLVGSGEVIPLPSRRRASLGFRGMARWGGLVAAMAVASWLGFTLGENTSLSFAQRGQTNEDGFLREMLDPSTGFLRDLTEGPQT